MNDNRYPRITLDPDNATRSMQQLGEVYRISPETLGILHRIVKLFPRPAQMYINDANTPALLAENQSLLMDLFTFDVETDELILYSREPETLIDGLIEMAMYLTGFLTMIGDDDAWVVEFTIGVWKRVKKRIKRDLDITVSDTPTGLVGLPPGSETADSINPNDDTRYPFRTLVSDFTFNAFYQMVILAARENIAIYFPPDAHHRVMAVYVYMRRAMETVAQGIGLNDAATFNERLLQTIRRLEHLFKPATLPVVDWSPQLPDADQQHAANAPASDGPRAEIAPDSPFAAFIEELFADDDDNP